MAYSEDITKLRQKFAELTDYKIIGSEEDGQFYQTTLIQIMNEAERQKQKCNSTAEQLRRQASVADGQAAAYGMVSSIVYNVVQGFVSSAQREVDRQIEEQEEKAKDDKEEDGDKSISISSGKKKASTKKKK